MDWNRAIERNTKALRQIVAALFALAAAALTSPRERGEVVRAADRRGEVWLPRHLYATILLILRPAESALRRLIVIAARGLSLNPRATRPLPAGLSAFTANGALKTPAFSLFDPLKRFSPDDYDNNALPHVSFHSRSEAEFNTPYLLPSGEQVDASQLLGRLRALRHALSDLPRQARRLARWQTRRDLLLKAMRPTRITPFRPGLPPGWRQRPIHEVDVVLRECHSLALDLMNGPDSG